MILNDHCVGHRQEKAEQRLLKARQKMREARAIGRSFPLEMAQLSDCQAQAIVTQGLLMIITSGS